MSEKRQLEHPALVSLFLVLAVLAVYLPLVGMGFINWDDPDYIIDNRPVRAGLTLESVAWAFTHSHSANWHPLTWLSHMLDCQLYGLNPAGHHLTNLLLHAANTVLLFLVLRSLTGAVWRSAGVAALFALHPMHVESVAWVAERKDVLSAFFGFLCLLAYAAYVRARSPQSTAHSPQPTVCSLRPSDASDRSDSSDLPDRPPPITPAASRYYLLAVGFYALGLMSKPMLVTWPFVLLLLDFWPLGRFEIENRKSKIKNLLAEKLPFFALSAASCLATLLAQHAALTPLGTAPLPARLVNALVSYARYLGKLIWPSHLSVFYPYPGQWPARVIVLAALVLAAITLLAAWQARRRPYLLAGWLWFLGTLVPVIGVVKVGSQAMADRYTYLTAIGVFIMTTWGLAELVGARQGRRVLAALLATVLLMMCARLAQTQVLLWQDTETLFRHALAVAPRNFVAYNCLGFDFAECKQTAEAARCLRASLEIEPTCYPAWNKLGSLYIDQGRYSDAVACCETALRLNPNMAEGHGTLGLALMKQGKADQAIPHYFEAVRLKPDLAPAHYNLANALAARGRYDEAQEHYSESLRWEPDSADSHSNLAYLLARAGQLDAAVAHFRAAVALKPAFWQAHYGLADALARQGNIPEAIEQLQAVLRCRPDMTDARNRLARLQAFRPEEHSPTPGQARSPGS